jgi:hypothetical protein
MSTSKIVTIADLSLDLSTVKCFYLGSDVDRKKHDTLTVEFKTRYEYLQHPATGEWQVQALNDKTEVAFSSYQTAEVYRNDWVEAWEEYLED